MPKNIIDILDAGWLPTEQRSVSGPPEVVQLSEADHPCTYRIEVDVGEKDEEIRLLLDEYRFESVLKEVVAALVDAVERDGISCEKPAHDGGEG